MTDLQGRKIEYLRVSLTQNCNFNCVYCKPKPCAENDNLSADEIVQICKAMANLGVKKIRFTGGEPLLNKNLCQIIEETHQISEIKHISLTTNGFLLEHYLQNLKVAGLNSINISLDTTDEVLFEKITGKNALTQVINAIIAAKSMGFSVRLNCVPLKKFYQNQAVQMVEFANLHNIDLRFIELMPMGEGKTLETVKNSDILNYLTTIYGQATPAKSFEIQGPAQYYTFEKLNIRVGLISPMSNCFCENCNRVRLMANGFLRTCLAHENGKDLKQAIKDGENLEEIIKTAIEQKPIKHSLNQGVNKSMSNIGG